LQSKPKKGKEKAERKKETNKQTNPKPTLWNCRPVFSAPAHATVEVEVFEVWQKEKEKRGGKLSTRRKEGYIYIPP
jgi:hypothetical protein